MDHDITRYLNEHLAASSSTLCLLQKLADTHEGPGARGFFLDLQEAFEADRTLLENLLERLGQKPPASDKKARSLNPRTRRFPLKENGIEFWRIREGIDILTDTKRRIEIEEIARSPSSTKSPKKPNSDTAFGSCPSYG